MSGIDTVEMRETDIAIIGLAGRFPGADNLDMFWQNICEGKESISFFTDDELADKNSRLLENANYVKAASVLSNIDKFDASFFGYSPKEAQLMDPQQRIFLECAWKALEDAGYDPEKYHGLIGVYAGKGMNTYLINNVHPGIDFSPHRTFLESMSDLQVRISNDTGYMPTQVSYKLNLKGPSVNVQTACSTALVAVHLAGQGLLTGECNMALAGGVTIQVPQNKGYVYQEDMIFSPDGHCRAFDAQAQGTVFGSGVGIVVLKLLSAAIEDRDNIYAVIKGSAINNDGSMKVGYTAPSIQGQQAVISDALLVADLDASTISYVEAHGTGTALGDPIEITAMTQAFDKCIDQSVYYDYQSRRGKQCALGSIKTNIGHLAEAAGIAGLIKTILALKHQLIPPSLHYSKPNPKIDFENTPFYVNTELKEWTTDSVPRRAGVSAFGMGGTNAHVVLEEAPLLKENDTDTVEQSYHLLTISAKNKPALIELAQQYVIYLRAHPNVPLADLCFTATMGRQHFTHRLALVSPSIEALGIELEAVFAPMANGANAIASLESSSLGASSSSKSIGFLFTGQGSQYIGMGEALYQTQPIFRQTLNDCDELLRPYLGVSLFDILFDPQSEMINQTQYTQPALFALEYALAELWKSWGIVPSVVIGHSVGEYVAACIAGVFSLVDGLRLIAERGRLMQMTAPGAMAAVSADESEVSAAIGNHAVSIAAFNGPENLVISGTPQTVQVVCATLNAQGVKTKNLLVSQAFHSPLMEPILKEFERIARSVAYSSPQIKLISNLTGELSNDEIMTPEYWCQHLRQPVQFATGMICMAQQGVEAFIEIGPKPTLLGMGKSSLPDHEGLWLPSLRPQRHDWEQLLTSLAELYLNRFPIQWEGFYQAESHQRLHLPTYPFQGEHYWIEAANDYPSAIPSIKGQPSHPLLGQQLDLAGSQERRFKGQISQDSPAFLADHCIAQTVLLPMTGYLEMALAAGVQIFQTNQLALEDVFIQAALILPANEKIALELVLKPSSEQRHTVTIYGRSLAQQAPVWTEYATGVLCQTKSEAQITQLETLQTQCMEEIPVERFYQQAGEQGLQYGPHFKGIQQLWRSATSQAKQTLGQIQLPEGLSTDGYQFHPALLDACLQVLIATLLNTEGEDNPENESYTYVPMGIERLTVFARADTQLWSYAQLRPQSNPQLLTVDMTLFDEHQQPLALISGLSVRRIKREILHVQHSKVFDDLETWKYEIVWQPQPRSSNEVPGDTTERKLWLIFTDQNSLGKRIATQLNSQGEQCLLVEFGQSYQRLEEKHYCINPSQPADFLTLLDEIKAPNFPPLHGVLHLWSLDKTNTNDTPNTSQDDQLVGCGSVLHMVQALAQAKITPRLWLVTRGAQPVGPPTPLQFEQAPLWGMGRVIALEYPELHSVCLDLAPDGHESEADVVFTEIMSPDEEQQIAYRRGIRQVARLIRPQTKRLSPPVGLFQVTLERGGLLEQLNTTPIRPHPLEAGEVAIQVLATGLNFRDVLKALGMLEDQTSHNHTLSFGYECAGIISNVGKEVSQLKIGDEVIAFAKPSLASIVNVRAEFVIAKPKAMTFEEAATIPLTFLTAYYGFHQLAQLQPGDKVLIHAAAGGVGQAAVQLCQRAGAEIFATASPSKWDYLKSQGVTHLYHSRNLDFAEAIMTDTAGKGVDVVLNSLNEDFITKSFEVLAQGGRFIELGRRGIWSEAQVQQQRPDVLYFPFDLGEVAEEKPAIILSMFESLMQMFAEGSLRPLPRQVFSIENLVTAFQYMQQARHIGKVVISQPQSNALPISIRADSSYLITGGLGALGLKVAQWLVEQGASYLVLAGRSGAESQEAQEAVQQLEQTGAKILVARADVSQETQVSQLVEEIQAFAPLRGVIHAAGTLADGVLAKQSWESFRKVMAPKIQGAWNLHLATQNIPLDFFICFSSVASLLGSAGQSNYAAANAFMDALVHHRRALGLPGLAINWGPWAELGMAANLSVRDQRRLTELGLETLPLAQGLQLMGELMGQGAPQVAALPINWVKWLQQFAQTPTLLDNFKRQPVESSEEQGILQQLETAPVNLRRTLLMAHVQAAVSKVLGIGSSKQLAPHQGFFDYGMDSLTSIELRNILQSTLKCSLSQTLAFTYPTTEALLDYLIDEILSFDFIENTIQVKPNEKNSLEAEMQQLSAEEVEALLLKELEELNL